MTSVMNRRTFLCGLTVGMSSTPVAGEAEQTARAYRIGYLSSIPIPLHGRTHLMEAFEQGLRETGFTPGLNLTIELRSPRLLDAGRRAPATARGRNGRQAPGRNRRRMESSDRCCETNSGEYTCRDDWSG